MKTKVIKLSSYFDRSISTRAAIRNLFIFSKKGIGEVVINFHNISFISSSASHQLTLEINDFEQNGIHVTISNVGENIGKMIELSKTDRKNIFTVQNMEQVQVRSEQDLAKLLLGV